MKIEKDYPKKKFYFTYLGLLITREKRMAKHDTDEYMARY